MKTLTTMTAVAALLVGISIASAQNPGGPASPNASPSNVNKGSDPSTSAGAQSGSQSGGTAMKSSATKGETANSTGNGKFCIEVSKGGSTQCKYVSMAACEKDAQAQGLKCSPNPQMGTTGSKQ